jgi:hypothetical protein
MATVDKLQIKLQTGPGGDGVATLYFEDAGAAQPDVVTWATSVFGTLPAGCSWEVQNSGESLDVDTGIVVGNWFGGATTGDTSGVSGSWLAGVGCSVRWMTDEFVVGRRISGRTFIVPMRAEFFDTNGTLKDTILSGIGASCDDLIAAQAANFVVYRRKLGARNGSVHFVTSVLIPDQAAWLTSRRH